jgi:hypothetical protein
MGGALPPDDDAIAKDILASFAKIPPKAPSLPRPDGRLPDILKQRHAQRAWIFWGAITMSASSFLLLIVLLAIQIHYLVCRNIVVLNDKIFTAVIVGIFTQIVSVIIVISKAVWDDKNYAKFLLGPEGR